jgi:transketolase
MRDSFVATLTKLAKDDPKLFLITGDLGFGVLTDFSKKFPNQFLNVGVAEQNMTGIATGLALEGRTVFTYSIANFPTLRCLEQIRNDSAYHNANVKIVSIGGGFSYGALGMSHHATEDLSILRSMPITVVSPANIWETEKATEAIIKTHGTCYFRLDKSPAKTPFHKTKPFKLGKAHQIKDGRDITLISTGGILEEAIIASENLEKKGIQCRLLSMHTIKPLDQEAVWDAAQNTGGILTIEEHTVDGGLGGAVAETCLENGKIPDIFYRIGLRIGFSSIVGSQDYLRKVYQMDRIAIENKVIELLTNKSTLSKKLNFN